MRKVTGIAFDEAERAEINRARRWLGIHPNAGQPTTRGFSRYAPDASDQRRDFQGMLNGLVEDPTPVFAERLERVRAMLTETLAQAERECDPAYWNGAAPTSAYIAVLVEARQQAVTDLTAALRVIRWALADAEPAIQADKYESV